MIKQGARTVVPLGAAAVVAACSSSTAGLPSTTARTGASQPRSSVSSTSADAVASAYVRALFVDEDAAKAASLVDPSLRRQALTQAKVEIQEFGAADKYQPGTPSGAPTDTVIPVKNIGNGGQFLASSYKVHLSLGQSHGSWLVNGYQRTDWDARSSAAPGGKNPPFTCTPGFVTTLRGYPVSGLVAHYPVPNLQPDAGIAGHRGIAQYRSGTLDVLYTLQSTGLPHGPSRSMYACFVRHAAKDGWQPDRHMNALEKKDHKPDQPLVYYFFDSGSRYKGGNELSIGYFTAKQAFGHGDQLQLSIEPNGFLPDLHRPPK